MCCLGRTPVRRNVRKLTDHQRLDVGLSGFLVIEVCADVADVRISQADNLARVTWVGEDFLITGKAGIENDFAAAARDRAGRAAIKDSPILQCENCRSVQNFAQCALR